MITSGGLVYETYHFIPSLIIESGRAVCKKIFILIIPRFVAAGLYAFRRNGANQAKEALARSSDSRGFAMAPTNHPIPLDAIAKLCTPRQPDSRQSGLPARNPITRYYLDSTRPAVRISTKWRKSS